MSTREQAVAALAVAFGTVPGVKAVYRQFVPINEVAATSLPCVILEDDGPETIEMLSGGLVNVTFEVSAIGYVESNDALSTAVNALDLAIKKAVNSDSTLGGLVINALPLPYKTRSGTANAPYGWFDRPISIIYEGVYINGM